MKKPKGKAGFDQHKKQNTKLSVLPQKKTKPISLSDYFTQMDTTERILLAYTVYKKPKDWGLNEFYSYGEESFRYLDNELPGLAYHDITKLLEKWTKLGILEAGRFYDSYNFVEDTAAAFWQWIDKQVAPEVFPEVPEQVNSADLSSTLDNMLNILVMIERGEVLVTQNDTINKNSVKRILTGLFEPSGSNKIFSKESYFFWLFSFVQSLKLIGRKKDHLVLLKQGRELSAKFKIEDLLSSICPTFFRSIRLKGSFLVLPVLARCTSWTSWGHIVTKLIASAEDVGNLLRRDRVISLLDPLRFLGLVDWGEYQKDILVRATPLGQLLILNILQGQNLNDFALEIKTLTDPIYSLDEATSVYIQPNFEILVPRSAAWTVRWQLSQIAVLEQQDQMLKYRLDKTHLLNALKRGLPADEVLSILTKLSTYPLPENIVLTVSQWVESFGQVTFMQLSLLECSTPEQAAGIASSRKYQEYVLGLYSPTAVIIREPEKLRKLLEKQSIYPLPGVLDGQAVANRKGLL